jgi:hypothetical protein
MTPCRKREGPIGNKEIALAVMAITAIAGDVRIDAQEVPKPIRRRADKLFEGDRNRNRTPEPVASLPKQEGTVQWKRTDQSSNRSRPPTYGRSMVKRDLFEEVEGRP